MKIWTILLIIGVTFCIGYWTAKSQSTPLDDTDYVFNVVDDSIVVYHNDLSYVGTVKIQGQLDSLIIDHDQ